MSRKYDRGSVKERLMKKKLEEDRKHYDKGQEFLIKNAKELQELGAENLSDIKETIRDFKKLQDKKAEEKAKKAMEELLAEEGKKQSKKQSKKKSKKQSKKRRQKQRQKEKQEGKDMAKADNESQISNLINRKPGSGNAINYDDSMMHIPLHGEGSEIMYLQEGGKVNQEFRNLLIGLSRGYTEDDQEKTDRALIDHIKYFIEKDAKHITVKAKKKSWTQFLRGSTQSSVIYTLWKKHIINDICHDTRRGAMGLTLHSYGCSKSPLDDEEKKGLNILFNKYIYINGKEETDWLDAETKQFIDSKTSVFHRAKDEIRAETEHTGGRKSKYNIKMARKFRSTRKKRKRRIKRTKRKRRIKRTKRKRRIKRTKKKRRRRRTGGWTPFNKKPGCDDILREIVERTDVKHQLGPMGAIDNLLENEEIKTNLECMFNDANYLQMIDNSKRSYSFIKRLIDDDDYSYFQNNPHHVYTVLVGRYYDKEREKAMNKKT